MNAPFQPRTMQWNGEPFIIEEPAICYRGYDLDNVSLEDYFPDLREDWNRHIKDIPFDEIEFLSILQLVSQEKTLQVCVMLDDVEPAYPELLESSGITDGWHAGGVVKVAGQSLKIKGVHVAATEDSVRAQIEANRRAMAPPPVVINPDASVAQSDANTLDIHHTPLDSEHLRELYMKLASMPEKVDAILQAAQVFPDVQRKLAEAQQIPEAAALEIYKVLRKFLW